jgi:hypothetical protein
VSYSVTFTLDEYLPKQKLVRYVEMRTKGPVMSESEQYPYGQPSLPGGEMQYASLKAAKLLVRLSPATIAGVTVQAKRHV